MGGARAKSYSLPLNVLLILLLTPAAVVLIIARLVLSFSRTPAVLSEPLTGSVFLNESKSGILSPSFFSINAILPLPSPLDDTLLVSDVTSNAIYQVNKNAPAIAIPVLQNAGGAISEENATALRRPGVGGMAVYDVNDNQVRVVLARYAARDVAIVTLFPPDASSFALQPQVGSIVPVATTFNESRLNSPHSLCVDDSGNIFFSDPTFGLMLAPDEFDRALDAPAWMEQESQNVYYVPASDVKQAFQSGVPVTPRLLIKDMDRPVGVAVGKNRLFVAAASPRRPILAEFDLITSDAGHLEVHGEMKVLHDWTKSLHGWGQRWYSGVLGHLCFVDGRWLFAGAADGMGVFDVSQRNETDVLQPTDWMQFDIPPGPPSAVLDKPGRMYVAASNRIVGIGVSMS